MIPWLLIAIGGVMVFSGVKGTNPLAVLKGVLDGSGIPQGTTGSAVSGTPTNQTPDASLQSPTGSYDPITQQNRNANTNSNAYQSPTGAYDPRVQQNRNNYTPGAANRTPLTNGGGRVAV